MPDAPYPWQLVRVQFDPVFGPEQAGERPALIVSHEAVNESLEIVRAAMRLHLDLETIV